MVLDLDAPEAGWRAIPQPFERRALAVATAAGNIVALGGMSSDDDTSRRVDVFDPAAETWTRGPDLPEVGGLEGFGIAAVGLGDHLAMSGARGEVHLFEPDGGWQEARAVLRRKRFFHRLVAYDHGLLFIAGASREDGHLADVEHLPSSALDGGGAEVQNAPAASRWPGHDAAITRRLFLTSGASNPGHPVCRDPRPSDGLGHLVAGPRYGC